MVVIIKRGYKTYGCYMYEAIKENKTTHTFTAEGITDKNKYMEREQVDRKADRHNQVDSKAYRKKQNTDKKMKSGKNKKTGRQIDENSRKKNTERKMNNAQKNKLTMSSLRCHQTD